MKLSYKTLNLLVKSFLLIWLFSSVCLISYAEPDNTKPTVVANKEAPVSANITNKTQDSENQPNADDKFKSIPNSDIVRLIVWLTGLGLFFCFIIATYFVRDHSKELEPYLGGGLLIQTIVVIMIVQCVLALALARILNATEIGTIYGGIIGYIFGRRESPKNKPEE